MPDFMKPLAPGLAWERPVMLPLPCSTQGVERAVSQITEGWKFNRRPEGAFWSRGFDLAAWEVVIVPGYLPTQGILVQPEQEYAYHCSIEIPADSLGKRIYLRFDGVNCAARVWVNGEFLRSHYGGYTSWYCEITAVVTPGEPADLVVGVTDRPREISSFHSGGILRDVRLVVVPMDPITRFHVETDLDGHYRKAHIKVTLEVGFQASEQGTVTLRLTDPAGKPVAIQPDEVELRREMPEQTLTIPIPAPELWDSEHPRLYRLEAALTVDGEVVETVSRQVGLRKIEVAGERMLVNGREVKLRGVNRHDTYPTTGRTVTPELVEEDVRLFRAANINFIRTSHYPPREDFLDLCDRYGIYVEDEISVAFVYQFIEPTMNDPQHTSHYLGQLAEMVERDRSHACVILWSLANESYWGMNFQAEMDYVRKEDATRPVIFSYPITIPDGSHKVDVWSLHYGSWDFPPNRLTDNFNMGEAWGPALPVLHDEFAHIPCYDFSEQARDPAVREFWGESIKRFWENIFTTQGALGGAIWAGLDDVLIVPGRDLARFEWGIIDGWRREKPEYWLTKKAYSPIRIADALLAVPAPGSPLVVAVKNWFDHTNLDEVEVQWRVGGESGVIQGPHVEPHAAGELAIPASDWVEGDVLNLRWMHKEGFLVDEFNLTIGTAARAPQRNDSTGVEILETDDDLTVRGDKFQIKFSKLSGLIVEGVCQGEQVIAGGPFLHLEGANLAEWSFGELSARMEDRQAVVRIRGGYGPVKVSFTIRIDGSGLMTTEYRLDALPFPPPRARKLGVGVDVGGYREVGVAFDLPAGVDRLEWERKGLWSAYPTDHIGRPSGTAFRRRAGGDETCGAAPTWPWSQDERNYALFGRYDTGGRGTNDFRSMKQQIYQARVLLQGGVKGIQVDSEGEHAVRLEVLPAVGTLVDDSDARIRYTGDWVRVDAGPKCLGGTETMSNHGGDALTFTFHGSGIAWIGPRDLILGKADVSIDGKLEAAGIDGYNPWVIGTARGEEKEYRQILFSKEGLSVGEHTLRIVVCGEKNPRAGGAYVAVDALRVTGECDPGMVRLHILNEWNYPELTWGNYVKPGVMVAEGTRNTVRLRLVGE